jgi:hypothetical protein
MPSRIPHVKDYEALAFNRTIYPEYACNCTKAWKGNDTFLVFKATKAGIEKVFESEVNCEKNVADTCDLITPLLTDKPIVSGGHTILNLRDRFHISQEVVNSVDFSFRLIAALQEQKKKCAEFLVMLNDFYMEKDAGTDEGAENKYRSQALNPYIIPPRINEYLVKYSHLLGRTLDLHYCSEKNMADRFKRHIQNHKKSNDTLFQHDPVDKSWYMTVDNTRFAVITQNKPNCVAGNAATYRAIRYEITSNKTKDKFTSYVGVFPLCSLANVLHGYLAANAFYENFDLPTYFVFFGKSCF